MFSEGLFRGGTGGGSGEVFTWKDLSMEEFNLREDNFHEGGTGFSSIIKKTMRK